MVAYVAVLERVSWSGYILLVKNAVVVNVLLQYSVKVYITVWDGLA